MRNQAQNLEQPIVKVPGPIAVAITTGRPELARIGIQSMGALTQEQVDQLSDYAEAVVREVQAEREITQEMYLQIEAATSSVSGILGTFDRIHEAFRLMQANAGPEAVREALRNPRAKRRGEQE